MTNEASVSFLALKPYSLYNLFFFDHKHRKIVVTRAPYNQPISRISTLKTKQFRDFRNTKRIEWDDFG